MLRIKFSKILVIGLLIVSNGSIEASAQTLNSKDSTTIYTGLFNSVPHLFNYPLVGLANVANGDYEKLQVGLFNFTRGNLNGAQIGISNFTAGDFDGAQIGTLNVAEKSVNGIQVGGYNLIAKKLDGVALGALNMSNGAIDGAQLGAVNIAVDNVNGGQFGTVNLSAGIVDGIQVGVLNMATEKVDGTQIGTLNICKKLDGFQLGVFNYIDSLESGTPFGLISIVRKGGYFAIDLAEVYTSANFPGSFSVRLGTRSLYTKYILSAVDKKELSYGLGFGSLIPITRNLFVNPELVYHQIAKGNTFWSKSSHTSLSISLGTSFFKWLQLSAGPIASLSYKGTDTNSFTLSDLYNHPINDDSRFHLGFKASLTIVLSK